jgi:pyruvate/2-oxoglutarate dehydrogenase complex dihydrolipoamide acyltransferase (E2) component
VRLRKNQDGRTITTSAVLLVFGENVITLPASVRLHYQEFKVREFMPTPTRCYACQAYGHTGKSCRATALRCPRCAGSHAFKDCPPDASPRCANCKESHSASYKGCKAYKDATSITNVASSLRISYAGAVKRIAREKQEAATTAAKAEAAAAAATKADALHTATAAVVAASNRGESPGAASSSANTAAPTLPAPARQTLPGLAPPQTPSAKRTREDSGTSNNKKPSKATRTMRTRSDSSSSDESSNEPRAVSFLRGANKPSQTTRRPRQAMKSMEEAMRNLCACILEMMKSIQMIREGGSVDEALAKAEAVMNDLGQEVFAKYAKSLVHA